MKVNFEIIYEHIGYLFYAVARECGSLSARNLNRLTELIEKNWKPVSNGDPVLNMHLADCIHAGVRYAIQNGMSSDQALTSFVNYYCIHPLPFGTTLRKKIIASAAQIAKELSPNLKGSHAQQEIERLFGTELVPA